LVAVHVPPVGWSPQDPFTHVAGAVHCALVVHVLTQVKVVVSQRPGAQLMVAGVMHMPVPLHVAGGVRVGVAQLAAKHWVPEAQRAHCPTAH
jgi:hypothetical protein